MTVEMKTIEQFFRVRFHLSCGEAIMQLTITSDYGFPVTNMWPGVQRCARDGGREVNKIALATLLSVDEV